MKANRAKGELSEIETVKNYLEKKDWCLGLILTGSRASAYGHHQIISTKNQSGKFKSNQIVSKNESGKFKSNQTTSKNCQTIFQKGDIDWLIITQPHRLWWARWQISWWSLWRGKKRWPGQKQDQGWCFNTWLEAEHLRLPVKKRSLFSLGELSQGQWLIDKIGLKAKIWQENDFWITKILKKYGLQDQKKLLVKDPTSRGGKSAEKTEQKIKSQIEYKMLSNQSQKDSFFQNQLLNWLNNTCYLLQRLWMRPRGEEIITRYQAFFHPFSRGDEGWQARLVADKAHREGRKVVLVTGVFDLLHQEHQAFLRAAKQAGDVLLVGLESDSRVKALKGQGRPIWPARRRLKALQKMTMIVGVEQSSQIAMTVGFELSPQVMATAKSKLSSQMTATVKSKQSSQMTAKAESKLSSQVKKPKTLPKKIPVADAVWILPENFGDFEVRAKWLFWLRPDKLAVSASTPHLEEKRREIAKFGGQLAIVHPHNPSVSTTQIITSRSHHS